MLSLLHEGTCCFPSPLSTVDRTAVGAPAPLLGWIGAEKHLGLLAFPRCSSSMSIFSIVSWCTGLFG